MRLCARGMDTTHTMDAVGVEWEKKHSMHHAQGRMYCIRDAKFTRLNGGKYSRVTSYGRTVRRSSQLPMFMMNIGTTTEACST